MVNISHLVKKYMEGSPYLQEFMLRGIIHVPNLAEGIKPYIEKELGKVKESAIIMALRRYGEQLKKKDIKTKEFKIKSDIVMKTNIIDISVQKSPQLFKDLEKLYKLVNYEKGDLLNIIHGSNEVTIITNEKFKNKISEILKNEKTLNIEKNLISLSLNYPEEFLYTPGVIFNIIRKLALEGINIFEVVTTRTELTLILNKKDLTKSYNILENL